jgi:ribosomal protein S18
MANEASWAITLPNQYEPFGNILQRGIAMQGEQNQMLYNQQQKEEQDKWKKLSLIRDFTDLSKHKTGSDVANAIGKKKMADILQKYTMSSQNMSPEQLQFELSKDVSNTVSAMDGIKQELELGDASIKQLKQNFPNLNAEQMAKDWRGDVLNRRLKNENEFNPDLTIEQPGIDFSNPETLSKYVTGNKNILKTINDDKGNDVSVLMGKQGDYTRYEGKIKDYQRLGFDPTKVNEEGFYIGKDIPSFKTKSTILPKETMTDASGNQMELIEDDVYKKFTDDESANLELIASAKKDFPNYDNLSPQEKNYAKRNTLFKIIASNDQNRINPTGNVRPPVTHNRTYVNTGGKTAAPIDLREQEDVGEGFKDVTSLFGGINSTSLPTGGSFRPAYVRYNPITKQIKYKDYVDKNKEGEYGGTPKEKTVSLVKFKQDLKTQNPQVDMKFLDGLDNPITGKAQEEKPTSKMVIMVLPNGVKGQIPEDQVSQFLKDNPKAKRQ